MKALFVGLGSIGIRHLRNLRALCGSRGIGLQVVALRSSGGSLPENVEALVDLSVTELPEGQRYDLAFVTNPTHLHGKILKQLDGLVDAFFIEKPIFESTGYQLEQLGLGSRQKAYVAAPMRWCGVFSALCRALTGMRVYSVRAICSSYLPDWRPATDYRKVYSANRDMGGGVALDLIHEWDYLTFLFGLPEEYAVMRGRFSSLKIDSDDLAVYIARYPGFLCELHLDYFGRKYQRQLEVFSEAGCLIADFGAGTLRLPDGKVEEYAEPANRRYEREMEYFVDYALHGSGQSVNSPEHAMQILKIALGEEL